jgi:hypothetical protein
MASNISVMLSCSASLPPARTICWRPVWISCMAWPIASAEVVHADDGEYVVPSSPNTCATLAEAVLPIACGTM